MEAEIMESLELIEKILMAGFLGVMIMLSLTVRCILRIVPRETKED